MTKKYPTIALKISGEAFSAPSEAIRDSTLVYKISLGIKKLYQAGIKVILIVGGGNICRGIENKDFMDRVTTDQIGMLATLINALVLRNTLENLSIAVRIQSAIRVNYICEPFIARKALSHLSKGKIVIFATGTGNPFFSTDTASVLRALEMKCDCLLKITKVRGVFSEDPSVNPNAEFFSKISYDEILSKNLKVMDIAAISIAKENKLPIKILSFKEYDNLLNIVHDHGVYSLVN